MARKHSRTWQIALISSATAGASGKFHSVATGDFVSAEHFPGAVELSASSANGNNNNNNNNNNGNNSSIATIPPHLRECGIWLAPSAIEGAGLGMYAGKDYKENDYLQLFGDVVIPIVDRRLHNQRYMSTSEFLWEEYVWNGWVVGTDVEGLESSDGASPGFGSVANSFLPLVNVHEGIPQRGTAGLHRSKDPGVGAFSSYYDRQSQATRDISAGEEFYVDYGDHWFKGRTHFGPVPLYEDLHHATELFHHFDRLKRAKVPPSIREEIWDTFVRQNPFNQSRVFGSFHHSDEEELKQLAKGKSLEAVRVHQAKKTTEWLLEHGTCGDLIYGGPSTLEQAGRGAFASTDLPEGAVVAQLPLIHLPNRSRLDMFFFQEEGAHVFGEITSEKRPPQLLLNYCYGHNESTLLLCPYGPIVNYVNHNQTRANVKIVWADPVRSNFMPHLLNESLESFQRDSSSTAKLAFDMVTLRPIAKGEEIFLDYGDSWEQAWQAHLQSWQPVMDDYYLAMEDFIRQNKDDDSFRTVFEQIETPYPSNLVVECNAFFLDEEYMHLWNDLEFLSAEVSENNEWFECDILRKSVASDDGKNPRFLYAAVDVHTREKDDVLEVLPEIAFRLREQPYSSDMFLNNAFRHEIHIPNEMFPEAWRNSKK